MSIIIEHLMHLDIIPDIPASFHRYGGRKAAPVENGGKDPIIYRLSAKAGQDFFHPQVDFKGKTWGLAVNYCWDDTCGDGSNFKILKP